MRRTFLWMLWPPLMAAGLTLATGRDMVYRVKITGAIDLGLAPYVARVIDEAEEKDADMIIFDINTLGGRLDAMIEIRDSIVKTSVPTTAYVNPRAISAGALVALACKNIYVAPGATIGAATPVSGTTGEKASEKVVSYGRSEFRATAERNGRNPDVAAAMVDESIEIPDLVEKGKLLTMTTESALKWKIADGRVANFDSLLIELNLAGARVAEPQIGWAEHLVRFLNNPIIASILLAVAFFGMLAEVQSAGWGISGTASLIALALYFGSKYIVGLVGFEEAALIVVGLLLVGLEVFVIPGFGVAGILGSITLLVGLGMSLVGRVPTVADVSAAVWVLVGSLALALLGTFILFKFVERRPLWQGIGLAVRQNKEDGFAASDADANRVGLVGLALSDLRPSGTAIFDGHRLDVVTEGDYLEANETIRIVKDEGYRVIVRRHTRDQV